MKEVVDELILKEKKIKQKAKLDEQVGDLQKMLPKEYVRAGWFGLRRIPRFHIETDIVLESSPLYKKGAYIEIRDRKFKSLESMCKEIVDIPFYVEKVGAIVVKMFPFEYIIIREKTLYDIVKKFGEKWGYKKLIRSYDQDGRAVK